MHNNMNINSFETNNIYTNKKPKTMRGNQSYGLSFGVNENGGYDFYQLSAHKKEESFWEKWKNVIIAGTVTVGAVVLGVVGYNKGWFGKIKKWFGKTETKAVKEAPKVAEKGTKVVQDEISKHLETLNLGNLGIGDKTLTDLLKPNNKTVTKEQFVAVAQEIKECDLTDNAVKQAAVAVLERLRNNLKETFTINGFDTTQEIKDVRVLDEILKESSSVNDKDYWLSGPIGTLAMSRIYTFAGTYFNLLNSLRMSQYVDKDSFFEVLRIVQKKLGTDNSTEKINAAIQIVEQLRKNFKDDVNIKSFNRNQPIENKETLQRLFEIANSVPSIEEKDNFNRKLLGLIRKEKLADDDVKELFALYKKEIINSENISNFCKVLKVAIEKGIATEGHIEAFINTCINSHKYTDLDNIVNDLKAFIEKGEFANDSEKTRIIQSYITQFVNVGKQVEENSKNTYIPTVASVINVAIEKGIATEQHINDFIDASKDDRLSKEWMSQIR